MRKYDKEFKEEAVKAERLHKYMTLRRRRYSVHTICQLLKVSESGYYPVCSAIGYSKAMAAASGPYVANLPQHLHNDRDGQVRQEVA